MVGNYCKRFYTEGLLAPAFVNTFVRRNFASSFVRLSQYLISPILSQLDGMELDRIATLPEGWCQVEDLKSKDIYYWNAARRKSTWSVPLATIDYIDSLMVKLRDEIGYLKEQIDDREKRCEKAELRNKSLEALVQQFKKETESNNTLVVEVMRILSPDASDREAILGLTPGEGQQGADQKYRQIMKILHPDKRGSIGEQIGAYCNKAFHRVSRVHKNSEATQVQSSSPTCYTSATNTSTGKSWSLPSLDAYTYDIPVTLIPFEKLDIRRWDTAAGHTPRKCFIVDSTMMYHMTDDEKTWPYFWNIFR